MLGDVGGDLNVRASAITIDGECVHAPGPGPIEELRTGSTYSLPVSLAAAAMAFFLVFPRPLRACAVRVATRPIASLALGTAVLLAIPFVALVLLFTGIGGWFGLTLLFVFLALLPLGVLTGYVAMSDVALRKFRSHPAVWQSLAAILITVVVVSLLAKLPLVGTFFVVGVWLIGVGAVSWSV